MPTKSKVIGVRVDSETDGRLARFEHDTGVERVTLARNALLAALDYYERQGRISFPLILVEPNREHGSPPSDSYPRLRAGESDRKTNSI